MHDDINDVSISVKDGRYQVKKDFMIITQSTKIKNFAHCEAIDIYKTHILQSRFSAKAFKIVPSAFLP